MESQSIEYKKTWRDEYLKWICAFANTEGGKLYIGIDDNGNVCGVDDPYKLSEDIPNKIRNTMGLICTVNLLNNYLSTTPIQIRIYKDKIRLWNDGALPKEVPVEDLYKEHVSKPCNPNLANVFFKCGMIESWARGFSKITRYCEEENAKLPVIDLSLGGVTARCFASDKYLALMNEHQEKENVPLNVLLNVPLTERQKTTQKILDIIKTNPYVTRTELSDLTGISPDGIKWQLKQLKDKKVITRVGADKGGYWEIVSGDEK